MSQIIFNTYQIDITDNMSFTQQEEDEIRALAKEEVQKMLKDTIDQDELEEE